MRSSVALGAKLAATNAERQCPFWPISRAWCNWQHVGPLEPEFQVRVLAPELLHLSVLKMGCMVSRTVIVLAAGEGKRMKSALPKVLHPLLGRTLVGHVLAAAQPLAADADHRRGRPRRRPGDRRTGRDRPGGRAVLQAEQQGTGHAVRIALPPEVSGTVVVLNGDVPLLRARDVAALVEAHESSGAAATVLAAEVPDPTGLGRIVRDGVGDLERHRRGARRDAASSGRSGRSTPGSTRSTPTRCATALGKLTTDNDQGEEYLTDVFGLLGREGAPVGVHVAPDAAETLGCNDRAELAALRALLRDRVNTGLMRAGVTILDPATTWIDVTVEVEPRRGDRAEHAAARGDRRSATGAVIGPGHDADRHRGGRAVAGGPRARGRAPRSARARASGRTRTCGRARGWAARRRSARSSRSKNSALGEGRRCRICPMWATRRSASRPTSARATSSPTTTG